MGALSNNDGCVVARSNELKALSLEMGAAMYLYYARRTSSGGTFIQQYKYPGFSGIAD